MPLVWAGLGSGLWLLTNKQQTLTGPDDNIDHGRQLAGAEGEYLVHGVSVGAPEAVIAGHRVTDAGLCQRREKLCQGTDTVSTWEDTTPAHSRRERLCRTTDTVSIVRYNTSTYTDAERNCRTTDTINTWEDRDRDRQRRYNTSTQSPRETPPRAWATHTWTKGGAWSDTVLSSVYTSIQTTQRTERDVKTRSDTQIEHTITPTARDDSVSRFRSLRASVAVLHVLQCGGKGAATKF